MKEPSLSEKILAIVGLIFSGTGFMWLSMLPNKPPLSEIVLRLGSVAAVFSCLWLLTLCWAASFAYMAEKRGWSLRFAGIPFAAAGLFLFFFFLGDSLSYGGALLTAHAALVPIVARRLSHTRSATEQQRTSPFSWSV